jgi:hypothetical protein
MGDDKDGDDKEVTGDRFRDKWSGRGYCVDGMYERSFKQKKGLIYRKETTEPGSPIKEVG